MQNGLSPISQQLVETLPSAWPCSFRHCVLYCLCGVPRRSLSCPWAPRTPPCPRSISQNW
eukprot:3687410-Amphidinium_carterae.2